MAKPLLSIIIPAYNCEKTIHRMVNSILRQSFQDYELIIINDKSTDNTAVVIDELAKNNSKIIPIHQSKNGGGSVARNTGIAKSSGKYIMFFDADDYIRPKMLETFIKTIDSNESNQLVVSGMTINNIKNGKVVSSVDACTNSLPKKQKNEPFKQYILKLLGLDGRLYQVWNKLYLASIIKNNNINFQPGINFGEDLVFNLNYFTHMTGNIKFILKPFYVYEQDLDNGTFGRSSLIYENRLANYNELTKFISDVPESAEKDNLSSWIQYSWLYSHLLAVSLSRLTHKQKITNLMNVKKSFTYPIIGDKKIIGKKRVYIERILSFIVKKPRLTLFIMKISNTLKNSKLTSKLWGKLRQHINN